MASAGSRDRRIRFERRAAPSSDDYGNEVTGGFSAQFTRWAEVKPLKGGEGAVAARLQGTQPALVIVKLDSETRSITPDWRAVDVLAGTIFAIKTAADMEGDRAHLTMMCEAGVAP